MSGFVALQKKNEIPEEKNCFSYIRTIKKATTGLGEKEMEDGKKGDYLMK